MDEPSAPKVKVTVTLRNGKKCKLSWIDFEQGNCEVLTNKTGAYSDVVLLSEIKSLNFNEFAKLTS